MRTVGIVVLVLGALTGAARAGAAPPLLDFGPSPAAHDCAITFDDGPGPHTGRLLDQLGKKGIKATFFVLGEHAKRHPDLIRRMVAEGHEVENHSWDHPDMRKLSEAQRKKEIEDTVALLNSLGVAPHFFRPPYGSYDPALAAQAQAEGLSLVLWTRDSVDWRYHSVADLESHVLPVGDGAHGVFLFHDIHDTTITAMPAVLDQLAAKGCHFVTVARWAADNGGVDRHERGPAPVAVAAPPAPSLSPRQRGGFRGWLSDWLH